MRCDFKLYATCWLPQKLNERPEPKISKTQKCKWEDEPPASL